MGCRGGSGAYENGIDISYVTCYFEEPKWTAISNYTRKNITEARVGTNNLATKKTHNTRYVSAGKDNENWLISQIITGVQNPSQNEPGLAGGVDRFPTNGSKTQVSAANICSTSSTRNNTEYWSVLIYHKLGNVVKNT